MPLRPARRPWLAETSAAAGLSRHPHHGAPLERGGNWVNVILELSPYTAALARLAKIRSAGITDLRHGSIFDEDWAHGDRFAHAKSKKGKMALPHGVQCFAVAATLSGQGGDPGKTPLPGDGLVPLQSALGRDKDGSRELDFPAAQEWVACGMNHLDLLDDARVDEQLRKWLC